MMTVSPDFGIRRVAMIVATLAAIAAASRESAGQTPENVAVVINANSADSRAIGEYYAKARALPSANVVRIETSVNETIDRVTFTRTIEQPLMEALERRKLQDRILYIVLTKGIPLRVSGSGGLDGTIASVDSELTLLYRRMVGHAIPVRGSVENPYFLGDRDPAAARPFSHREHDIYLVTRLDAFRVDEAMALIDRASMPQVDGRVVLDQSAGRQNRVADSWLANASTRLDLQGHGERLVLETTGRPARDVDSILGYFSWGAIDPQGRTRTSGLQFVPGSIAAQFVGGDARTFTEPPPRWTPGRVRYAGSTAPLIGDLIRGGATGVAGSVSDPFLRGSLRPDVLLPAYLAGFNLIEAFYLAMPSLSWQSVIIGDPLCAPFRRTTPAAEPDAGEDPETGLPALFSSRRLATLVARSGLPEKALALGLRGEALLADGDRKGARIALEEALALAPRHPRALERLAQLDEAAGDLDAAIDKYRRLLEIEPENVIALNNLAYVLAVHRAAPADALPLAQRAVAGAPENAAALDTMAWIRYLLGDTTMAAEVIAAAARLAPEEAEIRLHAAVIFAAVGNSESARRELQEALRLNADFAARDDVQKLQQELAK